MGARTPAGEDRRVLRLDSDHPDVRILFLQVCSHAGDGPSRADSGDEDVDLAARILPDLRSGRRLVRSRIRRIRELSGHEAARDLPRKLLGPRDRALHAL